MRRSGDQQTCNLSMLDCQIRIAHGSDYCQPAWFGCQMAGSACAFMRQACAARVLGEAGVLQHGGACHAAQLTSEGVCHSTTVESEDAVRIRVSCAGLKRACQTQWDWRPSWSRGCGVAPAPRDLQRSGQGLLSRLSQHRQMVQTL